MTADGPDPGGPRPRPDESSSDAILPFGERLDEIAQERFNRTDWIEVVAAVLLALATIVAAWSAYQATRWSGEQSAATRSALEAKSDAAQQASLGGTLAEADIQLWIFWLEQIRLHETTGDNAAGIAFVEERFRDEFKPAFDAWLAQASEGEAPPGTPLEMEEYQPAAGKEAERLNAEADVYADAAAEANQTGDNFVLSAVVMASVLFFAGVGTKLRSRVVRLLMLGFATLLFLGGLGFVLSLPQNVGL